MRSPACVFALALAISMSLGSAASAQAAPADAAKPAANAWMLTPTPYLEWNKGISTSLRAERDHFWDEVTHREWPLTDKRMGGAFGGADWFDDGTQPEIPEVPNRAILTATFTAHRSVLSASEKSIYTEVTMRIEQVFEDRTGSGHLASHKDITIMLNGGTVAMESGQTLSDNTVSRSPFLQPEHSYLLVLEYHGDGDWYGSKENWDISNGVVKANTLRTQYLAKHGRSRLNGVAAADLGAALSKELYAGK